MNETQCRICLQYIDCMFKLHDKVKDRFIWEALNSLASVSIGVDDLLPQNVCWTCFDKLDQAIQFQQEVERSDKVLHNNDIECITFIKEEITDSKNVLEPTVIIQSSKSHIYEAGLDFPKVEIEEVEVKPDPEVRQETPKVKKAAPKRRGVRKSRSKAFLQAEEERKNRALCCMCGGKLFPNKAELEAHVESTHKDEIKENSERFYTTRERRECKYCKRRFRLHRSLQQHFEDKNFKEKPRDRSYDKKCYKKKTKEQRERMKVVCLFCGIVAATKTQLKIHEFRFHAKEFPFECPHPGCGKAFAAEKLLTQHSKNHEEKKHICDVCGKAFAKATRLEAHTYLHKEVKRYQCAHCPRTFTYKMILRRHIEGHIEEKIFRCTYCEKTYRWQTDLKSHIKGAHLGDYPYKCKWCSKGYFCSSSRKYHQDRCQQKIDMIMT